MWILRRQGTPGILGILIFTLLCTGIRGQRLTYLVKSIRMKQEQKLSRRHAKYRLQLREKNVL